MESSKPRSRLFRKPGDDDNIEGREQPSVVRAKPLPRHIARQIPSYDFYRSKDFVTATTTQKEFYGNQIIEDKEKPSTSCARASLSSEEKNKLSAKLLKAEMKGDKEAIARLKAKLEGRGSLEEEGEEPGERLLTKTDPRSGLVVPVHSFRATSQDDSLRDLVREEKMTTADDHLVAFAKMISKRNSAQRIDSDWTMDDVALAPKKRKKHGRGAEEEEEGRRRAQAIADQRRTEQTLQDCVLCVDSAKLRKHLIVALGIKTYLSVPTRQSLVEGHCLIVPMSHVSSSLQQDEDVYAEMRIWRKGLVAMLEAQDEDCVFLETVRHVVQQPHMTVECIPIPKELSDMVPIYFKKAIMECEEEWAQNQKLIDLSVKDLRRSIPRGFAYFAVDFGLESGFAHIIENEQHFPSYFGKEVVGGMMDLDQNLWRKPSVESFEQQRKKSQDLKAIWEPYDWTAKAKAAISASEPRD